MSAKDVRRAYELIDQNVEQSQEHLSLTTEEFEQVREYYLKHQNKKQFVYDVYEKC